MARILAVSDKELPYIYKAVPAGQFKAIDFIIGCGDLPFSYLEYILSILNRELYFVRGNHAPSDEGQKIEPEGAFNLHLKTIMTDTGILLAGIEGSLLYNFGPYQYSQAHMWSFVYQLAPKLVLNYLRHGRFLDILVTHAPPWGINDQNDPAHRGIKAFRWLIEAFQPKYHLHGHSWDYLGTGKMVSKLGRTTILNVTGYQVLEV